MPSYHLVYFDIRGRAECSRVLMALAGAAYTEERINPDQWQTMKTSGRCPFGQLPILELDGGRKLCQSATIFRFLAKELGIYPSSNYDQARADVLVDACKDIENRLGLFFWEKDAERKEQMKKAIYEEELPKQMECIEKLLQENNGGKGYFVGDKISHGDIIVFVTLNGYLAGGKLEVPEMVKKHPLLADHYNRVMNEPKILEYLKNRKPNPDWYPY